MECIFLCKLRNKQILKANTSNKSSHINIKLQLILLWSSLHISTYSVVQR